MMSCGHCSEKSSFHYGSEKFWYIWCLDASEIMRFGNLMAWMSAGGILMRIDRSLLCEGCSTWRSKLSVEHGPCWKISFRLIKLDEVVLASFCGEISPQALASQDSCWHLITHADRTDSLSYLLISEDSNLYLISESSLGPYWIQPFSQLDSFEGIDSWFKSSTKTLWD